MGARTTAPKSLSGEKAVDGHQQGSSAPAVATAPVPARGCQGREEAAGIEAEGFLSGSWACPSLLRTGRQVEAAAGPFLPSRRGFSSGSAPPEEAEGRVRAVCVLRGCPGAGREEIPAQ